MFIVIMAMTVTAMFVAAAFTAVNGDLPQSAIAKNRKSTYAAAEAGLAFYLNHLQQDPDYWTLCDKAPNPNGTEKNPVNLQWDGGPTDPRTWRTVPGGTSQYTIELLDTKNYSAGCVTHRSEVDHRRDHGHVQDPLHRPAVTDLDHAPQRRRDLPARHLPELRLLHRVRGHRPQRAGRLRLARAYSLTKCAEKYRSARASTTKDGCPYQNEISFTDNDKVNGPLHTNDESLIVCGTPTFGRDKTIGGQAMNPKIDTIEVRGALPGHYGRVTVQDQYNPSTKTYNRDYASCTDTAVTNSPNNNKFTPNAKYLQMPQSNQKLADVAQTGGTYYTGKTIIRLNGSSMDVTNFKANGTSTTTNGVAWPNNGVLYVDNDRHVLGRVPDRRQLRRGRGLRQRLRQRDLLQVADDRGPQRHHHHADARRQAEQQLHRRRPRAGLGLGRDAGPDRRQLRPRRPPRRDRLARQLQQLRAGGRADGHERAHRGGDPVAQALVHRRQLQLRQARHADDRRRDRAEVPRHGRPPSSGTTIVTGFTKNYWYDDRFRYRSPRTS